MKRSALVVFAAPWVLALPALAGPITPPPGPVASTHKTLSEVEPRIVINVTNTPGDADSLFKITQPGSYYLAGNITGVAGKHGIEIAVSGVTLDLNGFSLVGIAGMGAFDGVHAAPSVIHVVVRNGSIRSWGDEGVEIGNASTAVDLGVSNCVGFGVVLGQNSSALRCRVTSNTAGGIATGMECIVQSCSAQSNGGGGILAFNGCAVLDCTAFFNTGNGISTGHTSTVSRCSSVDNTLAGISVGTSTTISESAVSFNDTHGFAAIDGVSISNCTSANNSGNGFNLGDGAKVSGSTARLNSGDGFAVTTGATITACVARQNTGDGFGAADGSVITSCTAYLNGGHGISVESACTISGCSIRFSTLDGIRTGGQGSCTIINNTSVHNGFNSDGAGIHVVGSANRIEGNNCIDNDRGIDVDGGNNIIVRNTCGGNGINWTIVAGNAYGPIVITPNGPAVNGSFASAALDTTDPNANFTY